MGNLVMKVAGYIFLRYLMFFIFLVFVKNAKWNWSNLKSWEDWIMFFWLFGLPFLLELLIIGLPMSYALNRLPNLSNKTFVYILLFILFMIEFLFANWIYGTQSALIMSGISIILFLALFWKRVS